MGIPLTPKHYINIFSSKIFDKKKADSDISNINSERVLALNRISFLHGKSIVCFLKKQHLINLIYQLHIV